MMRSSRGVRLPSLLRLDLDAKLGEQFVVFVGELLSHRAASAFMRQEGHALGHALFPGVGRVIDGSRPRSFLNFNARLASSRASSGVRLTRLAAMIAATCFRLSSLMVLARMA